MTTASVSYAPLRTIATTPVRPRPSKGERPPNAEEAPEDSFSARFRACVAQRPARLAAAFLATVFAPAGLLTNTLAVASPAPPAPTAPAEEAVPAVVAAMAPAPSGSLSRLELWTDNAREAAATCPGLPAEVLVAIGHVETRLGRAVGPSSAGAMGPMQFLPSTWAAYGRDGDSDGAADIMNPVDALHGAAGVLCANGGAEPQRLRSALWNYNHSFDYVDEVLRVARRAG